MFFLSLYICMTRVCPVRALLNHLGVSKLSASSLLFNYAVDGKMWFLHMRFLFADCVSGCLCLEEMRGMSMKLVVIASAVGGDFGEFSRIVTNRYQTER